MVRRRILTSGVLIGIGVVGTLDEAVFHQLLDWHHFLELSGPEGVVTERARTVGLVADGLFHLVSTAALVAGLLGLWRIGRLRGAERTRLWAGIALGIGGFNLYDGVVQHKLLGLHQVRRGVDDLLLYDFAWVGSALAVLAVGVMLLRRGKLRG